MINRVTLQELQALYAAGQILNIKYTDGVVKTTDAATDMLPVFNTEGIGKVTNAGVILGVYTDGAEPIYKFLAPLGTVSILSRTDLLSVLKKNNWKLFNARVRDNCISAKEGQFFNLTDANVQASKEEQTAGTGYAQKKSVLADKGRVIITTVKRSATAAIVPAKRKSSVVITIPEGVDTIAAEGFSNCVRLTGVLLPSTLRYIKRDAFKNCVNLYCLSIPDNVKEVEAGAFNGGNYYIHAPRQLFLQLNKEYPWRVVPKRPAEFYKGNGVMFDIEQSDTDDELIGVPKENIDFTQVTSLVLDEPVTYVNLHKFFNLKKLVIGEDVKGVSSSPCIEPAMSLLKEVSIPKSFEALYGFEHTPWMRKQLKKTDGVGCYVNDTLYYIAPITDKYVVKEGTKIIAASALNNNGVLKTLILPDTVEDILISERVVLNVELYASRQTAERLSRRGYKNIKVLDKH